MEEKEKMDFQYLTRKQLQALCKKHGVPANSTNREMADRLSSFLKESEKITSQGESVGENSGMKMNENGSKAMTKVEKKVRFSPENETFVYEISGYKHGGRRGCTMKSRPKKQIQATDNDVFAPPPVLRKRAKRDVQCQSVEVKSAVNCDGNASGGLIRRHLRNREVLVEKSERDLVASRKNVKRRSSKMVRNEVPEENHVARIDDKLENISKTGGRFTRSLPWCGGRDSEIGEDWGGCENGVGRNVLVRKSAEAEMGLQKTKQDVAKDENSDMLGGNSRKVESVTTRSQAKTAGVAAESKNEEETVQPDKGKVGSDGVKEKKETGKRSRNSDLEGFSDLEAIQDTSKVYEMVKNISVHTGPSRRTRRNTVMFNSTVSDDVELETQQNVGRKNACLTKNVPRTSRRNVQNGGANSAEPHKVLQQTEPNVLKDQGSEILSGNPRRLKSVNQITNSHTKTVEKASAVERETLEENVQLEEHSKALVRHTSRRKSVLSQKGKVGSDVLQEKEGNRKRSRNNDLKGVSELEAFVEPSNEVEMVKNVPGPSGLSRRTRHNTVMLTSSISANELSENQQTARQKDVNLTKNLRKSSRIASRANSAVTFSEVDGTADDVGKVRQKNRRQEPIVDEPLTKRPLKRSIRIASKMDLVEPAEPNGTAVGKKQHGRSKMPITKQKALCSEKLSVPDDGRLAVEEAENYKNKVDASYSKQVFECSKKKREANQGKIGANKQHGSFEASTVNSDTDEAADTTVNLEETLVSTLVKLPRVSTDQVTQNSLHEEFSLVGDILDGDRDEKSCLSVNKMVDFGYGNMVEHKMTTSLVSGFSPFNQSNDSAEPFNFVDLEKVNGAEEPRTSDNVGNQSNKDDRSSVQEYHNQEQVKDAKESTMEPLVQEEVLEKMSEISQDITDGKGNIDLSDVAGICDTECFPEGIKLQEFTAKPHHVTTEIGAERTTETPLCTYCDDVTEATLSKLAVKSRGMNEAKEQNIDQSTVLERSNANFIGQEEYSVKGTKISDKTTSGCEISVNKAGSGIFSQAKTEDNVTTDRIETTEAFNERVSQVVGEKIITEGSEGTLLVGRNSIPVSIKKDGIDAKKENEVSERYTQDAMKNEHEVSEQNPNNVKGETGGKPLCELPDAAVSRSELVLEKIYDGAELVRETNGCVDIITEDVPFNEGYAANKGIGGKSLNGDSDEQCADVAKEENPECALRFELGDKSDHEVVVPHGNDTTGTSLTEVIFKESEVSDEKAVETMMKPAEYVEGVDNLKVEVSKFEDRNSDTDVIDVGALAQVSGNHLVEQKAMEERDGSIQNERIEADTKAQTVAMKRKDFLDKAGNLETLVSASPMIIEKTFGDEFVNDKATAVLNKVTSVDVEDRDESSNDVMGFVALVDEANFGGPDNYKKEIVSDLERSAFVTSDNLMSTNSRAADIKEKVETIAGDMNSNDDNSDSEKGDDVDAIPQVTTKGIDYDLPEAKLCNADDSPHSVSLNCASSHFGAAADYVVEVSVDGKSCSENIEVGTKWIEKAQIFFQTNKSERKQGEKNSALGRFFADTSLAKSEMGSVNDAVDIDSPFKTDDRVTKEITLMNQIVNEGLNDSIQGLNTEDNAGTADKQPNDGMVCSTSNNLSCSNRRKIITEVAEEEVHSDKLCNMVVTEHIKELNAIRSVTPRMSGDCSAVSPTIALSKYESKSLDFHIDSPRITSWETNMIFGSGDLVEVEKSAGGISEANSITQDCEDAVQAKENLSTTEIFDQKKTENQLDKQEHHTPQDVSDDPIYDNEESDQKNVLSASNQEHIGCEIQREKSYVSAEELVIEAAATRSSNIADLYGFKAEYVSDDSKAAEIIAVDPGVPNCSRSGGNSTEQAHTEATKTMYAHEVENVRTTEPVTPKELCTGCENPSETSNEITGSILRQIFSSGSGCKEKVCKEMNKGNEHNEDYSNGAGRIAMADEDKGNICSDMALLFQDKTESTIGKSKGADSFSLEHDARYSLDVIKDQLDKHEGAANEPTFRDRICCLGLNQPFCGKKIKRHTVEPEEDGLHRLDDKVVTSGDYKKVMDFENSNVASTSITEIAVDFSAISPLIFSSNSENNATEHTAESLVFTSSEMSLFSGPLETNNIVKYARDVKDDMMIMEEVAAQVTEEQFTEHNTAEEASEQKNKLINILVTYDNQNLRNESLKFEDTKSACDRNETIGDNEELNQKNELSAFNQEHIDCEIQKDKSYVSAEVLLIEAAATSSSNIAVADDPKAGNIAVDSGYFCSGSRGNSTDVYPEEMNEGDVHKEDHSNDAGRREMAGQDIGNICCEMALLFQEETEATTGKSKPAYEVETEKAEELHHLGDKVVAGDSKKVTNLENSNVASSITPEMAVDYSGISPVIVSSNCENEALELNVESQILTSREMNLLSGPYGKDEVKNSEAGALETNIVSDDARDMKDNLMIMEQVTEEQNPEHKTAEDVSKVDSNLCSGVDEPTDKGGKASTEQEKMHSIAQGATGIETDADDPWKLEMKLLSPQPKGAEAKSGRSNSLFAKNLNSSAWKQKNKSTLIQRTPKPKLLIHDMKENLLSTTKRDKTSNMTAEKTFTMRRALQDLLKK